MSKCIWKHHYQSNPVFFSLFIFNPLLLSFFCPPLSFALRCLVWLHEQLQRGCEAFFSHSSCLLYFFLLFLQSSVCLSLPASVLWLDSALFHPLTNTGTSVYLGLCFLWMFVSLILYVGWHASTNAGDTDSAPERPQSPMLALCHFMKMTSSHISPPGKIGFYSHCRNKIHQLIYFKVLYFWAPFSDILCVFSCWILPQMD